MKTDYVEFSEMGQEMDAEFGTFQQLRGQSAYEIAVDNGFAGTEEEWLESLKGEPGRDGEDGYTPQKGIDYFDGEKGEKGEKGDKGDTGGIDSQFIATYDVTTTAEIEEAYQAGKQVLVNYNGVYYPMTRRESATQYYFATFENLCTSGLLIDCYGGGNWRRRWTSILSRSGGTMTGALTLASDPTAAMHAATKQYVDNSGGAKIVTGTYVGTSEHGPDHPNSLTFDFVPKMLNIWMTDSNVSGRMQNIIINLVGATEEYGNPSPVMSNAESDSFSIEEYYYSVWTGFYFKVVGTTVSWYATSSDAMQFNASPTYTYMAIG